MAYVHNFYNNAEPGSIWRTSDAATIRKIKKAMRQADADALALERWARNGFMPPGGPAEQGRALGEGF